MTQTLFGFDEANAALNAAANEKQAAELIADGEGRRDVGMALAAARRPDNVSLGRIAMVRALLRSPDGWTAAALPQTKRDLGKLGVTSLEQLETPLPKGIRCRVKLALRRDDDGNERNRVRTFEVVGIDKPTSDVFSPTDGDTTTSQEGADDVGF